jgi:quercetin dioxygenase-like cupin family protein
MTMETNKADDANFEPGPESMFFGTVRLQRGPDPEGMGGTGIAVVAFEPGARTHWHSHPGGQFLYAVSGEGRVRSKNDAKGTMLAPGDIVAIAAGEIHFHGASPDAALTHVAVNGGGAPEWGDPVTDAEYNQGF